MDNIKRLFTHLQSIAEGDGEIGTILVNKDYHDWEEELIRATGIAAINIGDSMAFLEHQGYIEMGIDEDNHVTDVDVSLPIKEDE